ncbi:protein MOR1 [Artemisia annua]|uniref:Protein MOR1 n=1 Tax=Artemisia annua TaxID=35608 RepID=A0A2U1PTE2_ARTAN|nr:protein MOR1 [Artemisia annua]
MSEDEKLLKEAKKLPWEDRLLHKNWKVRNDANIDLTALWDSITDPKDPRIRQLGHFFKKTIADSNAAVQDKALDALIAYLKAADADVGRYAKEVCDAIVAKCLTGRPKTVEKVQMVFMLWVELEAVDAFLDSMEKAIKNKAAKAVVPAIDVMFQALSEFGSKIVPPKRILKMLPELFDHQDQNVRASSKGLTLELCRWIGKEPVKSILFEKMRETMKKELVAELANVKGAGKPTRKIRSEQDKETEKEVGFEASGSGPSEESAAETPQDIDEYELVDPIDILTLLEKSGFWKGVKATKWSERKDAVAELTKLASTKRIAPGDFTEICRTLKKLINDVNIAVAVEAVQAIGNLALGLRNHFSASSRFLLPVLLEKLKEKKPTMAEALTNTLQAIHKAGCVTLADIVEDVKVAVKNKVPLVRSLTLNWVTHCIDTSKKAVILKVHKDYVPICMECLSDGTPEVREAAFSVLAAIAKLVGMRPLEKSLDKLDEVRKKKLSEMIGDSVSGAPTVAGSGGTSKECLNDGTPEVREAAFSVLAAIAKLVGMRPLEKSLDKLDEVRKKKLSEMIGDSVSGAPTVAGSGGTSTEALDGGFIRKSAASTLGGKKPVTAAPAAKKAGPVKMTAGKKAIGPSQNKQVEFEDVEPAEMTLEEIVSRLGSLIQEDTITRLKSTTWKERLEEIISFKEKVESLQELDQSIEIIIRLLCVVPGWSEKNVQVQQQVIEVVSHIASTATKFPKICVVLCIGGICERVADIKTRAQAMKCLTTFSEVVGPGFVFERMFKIMKEHKNPKVLSEGLLWMVSAVEDFGVTHLKLKDVINFCKDTGLQSSAVATRNATIKLIGVLHKFVGPNIKAFLSDVKPALLSALEGECEKNPFEGAAAAPKKTVKASDSIASASGGGLPREDISGKITPALLKGFESSDWKIRLESIEAVNKIVEEANKHIQPTGTVELFRALRGRLYDSNKNLIMATLSSISALASAMGPAIEKSSKGILSDIVKCIGDNKKHMRECTLATLDSWVAVTHLEKMVPHIAASLTDAKLGAEGRKDLFDWLSKQLAGLADFPDAIQLLRPVSIAMTDKSADVRKAAEVCFRDIVRVCGPETVMKNVRDTQGPALAIVLERLKLHGVNPETFGTGQTGKTSSKSGKSNVNRAKPGSRPVSPTPEMEKRKDGKPGEPRAAVRRSVMENGSDIAEQSGEVSQFSPGGIIGPIGWYEALDYIANGSPEQSIEGMKAVYNELTKAIDKPEGILIDDLVTDADRLVACLSTMFAKTFDFSVMSASSRFCKYVLNTLMQAFQIKRLAHAVKERTLENLIRELFLWFLDERIPRMDDGSKILKASNSLILKILEKAERTSSFVVLISLLSPPSNTSFATRNMKFLDLVVKCLIKITKILESTINEVDIDRILQSIHVYLQELGVEEIKRRAGADDMPLRMVKTVLHELVKLNGTAIKGHLSMVPTDMEPQPIILAYIDLNLQMLDGARIMTPTGRAGQTNWGD